MGFNSAFKGLMQGEQRSCHYNKLIIVYTPFQVLHNSKTEFNNNMAPSNYLCLPITNSAPIPMMISLIIGVSNARHSLVTPRPGGNFSTEHVGRVV